MFGNLITNRQLKLLMKGNEISIDPFDEKNLKTSHYTLHIGRIFCRETNGNVNLVHSFKDNKKSPAYVLKAGEYIIVEAFEQIKLLSPGIVGRFIAPSNLIEAGLGLVAGQISNKYGTTGEGVRFGLKNLLQESFIIDKAFRVAHVEFFDLRGITIDGVSMSKEEKKLWLARALRAYDDGVDYNDGNA